MKIILLNRILKLSILMGPMAFSILSSCSKHEFKDDLIGQWQSEILYVKKNTFKGTDSTAVLDVNPENYLEKTGLKTSIIEYGKDHDYTEKYIGPDGTVKFSQSGYWFIKGDTVIMSIYKPLTNQSVQKYHFKIDNNRATFTSLMDYDGDGFEDDEFRGVSIRI